MSRPDVQFIKILQETKLNWTEFFFGLWLQFVHFLYEEAHRKWQLLEARSWALVLVVCYVHPVCRYVFNLIISCWWSVSTCQDKVNIYSSAGFLYLLIMISLLSALWTDKYRCCININTCIRRYKSQHHVIRTRRRLGDCQVESFSLRSFNVIVRQNAGTTLAPRQRGPAPRTGDERRLWQDGRSENG